MVIRGMVYGIATPTLPTLELGGPRKSQAKSQPSRIAWELCKTWTWLCRSNLTTPSRCWDALVGDPWGSSQVLMFSVGNVTFFFEYRDMFRKTPSYHPITYKTMKDYHSFVGESTISMVMFNGKLLVYQRATCWHWFFSLQGFRVFEN